MPYMNPKFSMLSKNSQKVLRAMITSHPACADYPGGEDEFVESFLALMDRGLVEIIVDEETQDFYFKLNIDTSSLRLAQ